MTRQIADQASAPVEIEINSHESDPSDDSRTMGEISPDLPLTSRVEALLITSDRPITEARMAEILGLSGKGSSKAVTAAIAELNKSYEQTGRSFRAERLAGGWQILTLAAFGPVLNRVHTER